jgi:precorrin isomerase/sirohydrochlorin ferrochelatase
MSSEPDGTRPHQMKEVHPIETESYRLLADRVDLSRWPEGPRAVVARVVHATADPALVDHLSVPESAVAAGVSALSAGATVVCDVEMVRAAISGIRAVCTLSEVVDAGAYPTRSAAAMARAAAAHPDGAVFVVGCAPSALAELVGLIEAGSIRPALVIGTPVGYVGATEAKEALLATAERHGIAAMTVRGERGGAAIGAAMLNALARLANAAPVPAAPPALLLIGHGTRSEHGAEELEAFAAAVARLRPQVQVAAGFIEFVEPALDAAIDQLVQGGSSRVVAVPLLLLGAGHLKDDGPAALARARARHPTVAFSYGRELGLHPNVLAAMEDRIRAVRFATSPSSPWPEGPSDAVVVVGRGSTDPDANGDLVKAARLLADGRGLATGVPAAKDRAPTPPLGRVEPAFVSLAQPGVQEALERCRILGAQRIAVVPYFLCTGLLVDRIGHQAREWAAAHPGLEVSVGQHIGVDERVVELVWSRYDEVLHGPVSMNCDGCLYRTPLPGYEHKVQVPLQPVDQARPGRESRARGAEDRVATGRAPRRRP